MNGDPLNDGCLYGLLISGALWIVMFLARREIISGRRGKIAHDQISFPFFISPQRRLQFLRSTLGVARGDIMSTNQKELQELLISAIERLFAKGFCIIETQTERSVNSIELETGELLWAVSKPGNQVEITIKLEKPEPGQVG